MKTEQLIGELAADLARAPARVASPYWARLLVLTTVASVPSALVIVLVLSPSDHFAHGVGGTIAFTLAAALALAAGSFRTALIVSRPEAEPNRGWLLLPALILAFGIARELTRTAPAGWSERLMGDDPLACFACVLVLSVPILFGALLALRHGAPSRPRTSGALAGLLAGGVTAALYTIHCPEDSLLFIAAWHVPAIALISLLGAALGPPILRW
jgi:hypothetical protein